MKRAVKRWASRLISLVPLLMSGMADAAQTTSVHNWQDTSYIASSFIKIALQREHEQVRSGILLKWQNPIDYYIYTPNEAIAPFAALMKTHLQQLSDITGLPLRSVPFKQARMQIFIVPQAQVDQTLIRFYGRQPFNKKITSHAVCYGQVKLHNNVLQGATIVIPIDNAIAKGKAIDCLIEETTQVLGLPNDSDQVFPSIFNDHSIDRYLSGLDYVLLKILFDSRLQTGMSTTEVQKLLPTIIRDLKQRGEIMGAERKVRSEGLYRQLGGS